MFDFELRYLPGPKIVIADTLRRAHHSSTEKVVSFTQDIASIEYAANEAAQEQRMVHSRTRYIVLSQLNGWSSYINSCGSKL